MPPSAEPLLDSASASSTARSGVKLDWLTQQVRCVRGSVSRRAMRASGDSPSHLSAKHHLLVPYLRLMVSFRGMLLTLQSGLERLTPQAHRVPVYPTVFPHSDMSLHGAGADAIPIRLQAIVRPLTDTREPENSAPGTLCSCLPLPLRSVVAWRRGETTQLLRHQAGEVDAGAIVQEGPDNLQPTGEVRAREAHRRHRGREVDQTAEARPEELVGASAPACR